MHNAKNQFAKTPNTYSPQHGALSTSPHPHGANKSPPITQTITASDDNIESVSQTSSGNTHPTQVPPASYPPFADSKQQATQLPQSATPPQESAPVAGDRLTITLGFSLTLGTPDVEKAKLTVTTLRRGKKQKVDQHLANDCVFDSIVQLLRATTPDDDLYRIIGRFRAEPTSA